MGNEALITTEKDIVGELCSCFSKTRVDDSEQWINLGFLLRCLSEVHNTNYLPLWISLSKQSSKFVKGECEERWKGFDTYDGYRLYHLRNWARKDNPKLLDEVFKKTSKNNLYNCLNCSHTGLASVLYYKNYNKFIVDKSLWYFFDESIGIWRQCSELLKEVHQAIGALVFDMYAEIRVLKGSEQTDETIALIKKFSEVVGKLNSTTFKSCVIAELKWKFEDSIQFDNKPHILGFKNGVYDLNTREFRKGRAEDYITMTTNRNGDNYESNH